MHLDLNFAAAGLATRGLPEGQAVQDARLGYLDLEGLLRFGREMFLR
jgi:hypothetical protein